MIWLLKKKDNHFDYDCMLSCVVRAQNEQEAREAAAQKILHENDEWDWLSPNVEGAEEWRNPEIVTCECVDLEGECDIILLHWHAG